MEKEHVAESYQVFLSVAIHTAFSQQLCMI